MKTISKKTFSLLSIFLIVTTVYSQKYNFESGAEYCSQRSIERMSKTSKIEISEPQNIEDYDVLDYKIEVDIQDCFVAPYPNNFSAEITISIKAVNQLDNIELFASNTSLQIISIGGNAINYNHENNVLKVFLDKTYLPNEIFEIQIDYNHKDVEDGAFYTNSGYVFTDCEPQGARKWFPCKDIPSDKATTNITATVPNNVKIGSNGRLDTIINSGQNLKFKWISRDPVATYLIVLTGKVDYNLDIVKWYDKNLQDTIPIYFYYSDAENPTNIKNLIGSVGDLFSDYYGSHPFEKDGFATLGSDFSLGGMENQTLTSLCYNCWSESLIVHEFAHQWFGDMITCKTWADLFLNEGFASWSEAFWREHKYGYNSYISTIKNNANIYLNSNPGWAISNSNMSLPTPSVGLLFNYAITYMKASCVLHQLRYVMGDSLYFKGIKEYATDTNFKYGVADIQEFRAKLEEVSNMDLENFFESWIYTANHPIYNNVYRFDKISENNWNVVFNVKQTSAETHYWQMPLEIKVKFDDASDTVFKFNNSVNDETFTFNVNKKPIHVIFDPNNGIVLKEVTTIYNNLVANENNTISIKPNPANDNINIEYFSAKNQNITFTIVDYTGKVCKKFTNYSTIGNNTTDINIKELPSGVYFINIKSLDNNKTSKFIKL